jgi:predicted HicB family RNase H-like nuclease
MDMLNYKGYAGTSELDMNRAVCRGKLLFIDDLVTYESTSPKKLQKEFEAAVDDYLETCALLGKTPQRDCKGLFNVRVSPNLHRMATLRAFTDNVSLNEVVVNALDTYLNIKSEHNRIFVVNESIPMRAGTATASPRQNGGQKR